MSIDAAFGFQSQSTKALASIDSTKYPDTNKDLQENIIRLNEFVDYIASYLQTMQKGIDKNNQDPIAQIQSLAADLLILLGGGELLYGIDLGDLQYFLPAIGALLGFDTTTPFPINLFNAAEHFFLGYVVPLDSFAIVIEGLIDGWLVALGIDPEFIKSLNDLLDAFGNLALSIEDFLTAVTSLLGIFGTDFPFISDIWHVITTLLGGLSLADLGSIVDPIFDSLAPWVEELAIAVNDLSLIIRAFSGETRNIQGVLNFASLFNSINFLPAGTFSPITAATSWIQNLIKPTNLLAPIVNDPNDTGGVFGFVPLENLAIEAIGAIIGSAQSVIDAILKTVGWPIGSGTPADVTQYFTDFLGMFSNPALTSGGFNPSTAVSTFITSMMNPLNLLAPMNPSTSLLFPVNIPGLDASKIISGIFGTGQIPSLDASKITSGVFNALQIPGLDASKIISGVMSTGQIPNLDASKIVSGVFGTGQIPNLDASKITSGIFNALQIPTLDASKIISGVFGQSMIPSLTGTWGKTVDGTLIAGGSLSTSVIPGLDASIIISGSFNVSRIPSLPAGWGNTIDGSLIVNAITNATLGAAKLTSGAIPAGVTIAGSALTSAITAANVPALDATKITTGVFSLAQIPTGSLGAGNIADVQTIIDGIYQAMHGGSSTGNLASTVKPSMLNIPGGNVISTLAATVIPGLDASKIISGAFSSAQIPSLPSGWGKTVDGSLLAGQVAGGIVTGIVSGNPITTDVQNTVDNLQSAVTNAVSTGTAPAALYSGFSNYFTSLVNVWGGNGQILGPTDPNPAPASTVDVATAMANINTTITGNSANITSIQSQLPSFYGGGTGGLSMDTSLTPASAAPAGFNAATIQPGTPAAWPALVYATPATTDNFTVSGSVTSSDGRTKFLFLRANSATAPTSYVYAWLQNNTPFTGAGNCKIGCVVAGVNTVFKTFALPSPGTLSANAAYDLAADAYTFTVSGPALTQSYVDSSNVSQMGTGYRYGGLGHTGWVRNVNQFGSSGTYTVPSWAASGTLFDIVGVGGGAGGQTPTNTGLYTNGGLGGRWNGAQPKYGTDIPLSTTTFGVTIGRGGAHGPTVGSDGGAGGNTTITATGYSTLTAAGGGVGTTGSGAGGSPGNYTYDNTGYTGGAAQGNGGAVGNAPGGGGSGGIWGTVAGYGGDGAPGGVWVRAIDTSAGTGPFNSVAVYDNAVAGPATATVTTAEGTTSTTPANLATTTDQVTINVGPSGLVIVFINAQMIPNTANAVATVSFTVSGANTIAAGPPYSMSYQAFAVGAVGVLGDPFLLAGLNPGATTFKMKYKTSAGTTTFSYRMISAIPL